MSRNVALKQENVRQILRATNFKPTNYMLRYINTYVGSIKKCGSFRVVITIHDQRKAWYKLHLNSPLENVE